MRLKGKKIIITGGGRGIGKAIALGFSAEGADIIITYQKNKELAEQVVKLIKTKKRKAKAIKLNVNNVINLPIFVENALDFLGEVNVLVNNVGIVKRTPFIDITEAQLDEVMTTNFKGTFFLAQLIARQMKLQKKGGSIINISSISDSISSEGLTHYQSAKAAISMLTKGAAFELARYNIRVNTISPGLTKTDMNKTQWKNNSKLWKSRTSEIPLGRAGSPEDHVGAAIFLASDESSWITGSKLIIDGGRSTF